MRFIIIFLLLSAPAMANPCSADFAKNYKPINQTYKSGALFKIEKCGAKPGYIFGTAHLSDTTLEEIYKSEIAKMKQVQVAAFEISMFENDQNSAKKIMLSHRKI